MMPIPRKVRRIVTLTIIAGIALFGLAMTAAFAMIFSGDPEFERPLAVSPEEVAAFAARFAQPFASTKRDFALADGGHLHAQVFPADSETTIVLVHGILSSGYPLNRASGLLRAATHATIVTVDLRGHGESTGARGDVDSIGQYEEDLGQVITTLRKEKPVQRFVLAGHSMGGGITLRYASRAATPGHDGNDVIPPLDAYLLLAPHLGPKAPSTRMTEKPGDADFARIHLPRTLGLLAANGVGVTQFNGLRTLFFNLPEEMPVRSYTFRAQASMYPWDYREALANLATAEPPLLLIAGRADEVFLADRYAEALRSYSKGSVRLVEGANHDGVLEDPRTHALVARWLADARR